MEKELCMVNAMGIPALRVRWVWIVHSWIDYRTFQTVEVPRINNPSCRGITVTVSGVADRRCTTGSDIWGWVIFWLIFCWFFESNIWGLADILLIFWKQHLGVWLIFCWFFESNIWSTTSHRKDHVFLHISRKLASFYALTSAYFLLNSLSRTLVDRRLIF